MPLRITIRARGDPGGGATLGEGAKRCGPFIEQRPDSCRDLTT
jgi:hypothetical protein